MYASIRNKKEELKRIESTIAELDAERQRKDREFSRLQVSDASCSHVASLKPACLRCMLLNCAEKFDGTTGRSKG